MDFQTVSSSTNTYPEFGLVNHVCPSCNHTELRIFYEVRNVPVHSCLMMPTAQEAIDFPRGDVILGYCTCCGFITNVAFDPKWSAYAPNYEDQQSFSPTFNKFALNLANRLIKKYSLYKKDIVEIGCSKGDFLALMCELGENRGVGIDPSVVIGRVNSEAANRIHFIQDYYSDQYSEYVGDFICCRHTLEHIHPTNDFISTVRKSIGNRLNTAVFFEIPDMGRVLRDLAFEDIYYEHCSYFTPGSLARLFRSNHFDVTDLYLAYGDQYLMIEALPSVSTSQETHHQEETLAALTCVVNHFTTNISDKLEKWKRHLQQAYLHEKRVVIWGSGSKCVAFLTTLGAKDWVQYVIDINPHRHGKFIPGVGKEIMPPEFLKEYKPDEVIVMNAIYCQEIQQMLEEMDLRTNVISI